MGGNWIPDAVEARWVMHLHLPHYGHAMIFSLFSRRAWLQPIPFLSSSHTSPHALST